jgi:hypothetical protein
LSVTIAGSLPTVVAGGLSRPVPPGLGGDLNTV